jgi:hypothetical protein
MQRDKIPAYAEQGALQFKPKVGLKGYAAGFIRVIPHGKHAFDKQILPNVLAPKNSGIIEIVTYSGISVNR